MVSQRIDWPSRMVAVIAAIAMGLAVFSSVRANAPHPPALYYQPNLELAPQEYGATAIGRVVLSNEGHGELIVGPFKTSCSCAGVEVERDGKFSRIEELRIPPLTQTEVVVRIAVGAKPGTSQQVSVLFGSNDPARAESVVEVHIPQVLGGVYAAPAVALFGDVSQVSPEVREIFIYGNGVTGRRVESVIVSHPDRFTVELVPPQSGVHEPQVHASAGQMIAVTRVRPKPGWVGPLDGYFEIVVAGETRPLDRVDVIGNILGPYVCTPEALSLPRIVEGKPNYRGEVVIARRDGKPITVSADRLPKGVTAEIVPDKNEMSRATVVISCEPVASPRTVKLRFQVQGGKDTAASVEVPLLQARSP